MWSRYLFLFCMSWDSLLIYCLRIISTISNLSWVCLSFWQTFCCIASCTHNSYCNSSYYILDITDLEHIRLLCLYNAKIFIELKCQNTFWADCTVYSINQAYLGPSAFCCGGLTELELRYFMNIFLNAASWFSH